MSQELDDIDVKFRIANVRSAATEAAMQELTVGDGAAQRRPKRTSEYAVHHKAGLGEVVAKLGITPAGIFFITAADFYNNPEYCL